MAAWTDCRCRRRTAPSFSERRFGSLVVMVALEAVLRPLATVLFNEFAESGRGSSSGSGHGWICPAGTLPGRDGIRHVLARPYVAPASLLPLVVPLLIAAVQATSGLPPRTALG